MSATSSSEPYSTSDLDAVHSVVANPIALKAFRESLTHGHLADGTSTIRAFTAMWSHPADHTTAEDLLWLLARMNNLKHLVLHVPLTQRRIPLGHMRALQSLNAEAALLRVLRAPHPPLRALSVYVLPADEASTYAAITRLFSKSLIKLRVLRTFDGPREEGSPARVCAALALPRLEYLEVRDLSAKCDLRFDHVDAVAGTPVQNMAVSGTPNLRMLVWLPPWHRSIDRAVKGWQNMLTIFQSDLLTALAPVQLLVCVSSTEGALGWSEGGGHFFLPEALVAVDGEEWRN